MDKQKVYDIMQSRLEDAADRIEEAISLYQLANKQKFSFNGSLSRSYYAIYKAISAIHILNGDEYKRHKDSIANFNKNYIGTNLFPKEYGRMIHKAEILRNRGDYADFFKASK